MRCEKERERKVVISTWLEREEEKQLRRRRDGRAVGKIVEASLKMGDLARGGRTRRVIVWRGKREREGLKCDPFQGCSFFFFSSWQTVNDYRNEMGSGLLF